MGWKNYDSRYRKDKTTMEKASKQMKYAFIAFAIIEFIGIAFAVYYKYLRRA